MKNFLIKLQLFVSKIKIQYYEIFFMNTVRKKSYSFFITSMSVRKYPILPYMNFNRFSFILKNNKALESVLFQ